MEPCEFRCQWIDKKDLWKVADGVRADYWPEETVPVDTEKMVESRLRLDIEPLHNLFSSIDMDAYLKMDLSGIVVDYDFYMNEKFANRMRFAFAHELGHFFLHRKVLSKLDLTSPDAWNYFIASVPDKEYGSFEWQANEFAGRLLVPRQALALQMRRVLEIIRENDLTDFLTKDADAVLSRISPDLSKPFGVSTDVIETRLKREELWPPRL